jgi:probable phosphoglycerate mutase
MATATGDPAVDERDDAASRRAPTRVVLVRHGVTAQTGPLLTGRTPGVDLSERGRAQAEAAADRLATLPVTAVYASPIERTHQTAGPIAARHGLDVVVHDGLIEADYGEWTGGRIAELAETDVWKVVQFAPSRASFPGGESIRAMQARIVAALDDLVERHAHETFVVVSHADPIKAAIAHYVGMHLDTFQRIHVAPASISVLEVHPFGAVLVKANDSGDLRDLVPEPEATAHG